MACKCDDKDAGKSEEKGKDDGKAPPEIVEALECMYKTFVKGDSKSLTKKYLKPELFEVLKTKKTKYNMTLLDCIATVLQNPDSSVGLYAPCPESYNVFGPLFDLVIQDYHVNFPKCAIHPPMDWGKPGDLQNIDPNAKYVVSTRVRTARSLKGYPFNPGLSEAQYKEIERKATSALCQLKGDLAGNYQSLSQMSDDEINKLIDEHILFKGGDRFLESAQAYRFWPNCRGVFINPPKTFIVWVNEEDHLRIISLQKDGDLAGVYNRLSTAVAELGKTLEFCRHKRFGYLSMCPTNIGTGIRASVHIKLPKMSKDEAKLKEIAGRLHLQIRGTGGEHTESKGGVLDISNKRRLGVTEKEVIKEMFNGIQELIQLEEKAG